MDRRFFMRYIFLYVILLCNVLWSSDWIGTTSRPKEIRSIGGKNFYVITTPEELAWFAYQTNQADSSEINAVLDNNIYFTTDTSIVSTFNWGAIGNTNAYNGTIDGLGHTIYGINGSYHFIRYTGESFVIQNLKIKQSSFSEFINVNNGSIISIENVSGSFTYGLIRNNYGLVKQVKNSNSFIVYENNGIILKCEQNENLNIERRAGLTRINKGLIDSSKSYLKIKNPRDNVDGGVIIGGLTLYNYGVGEIINSESVINIEKIMFRYDHYFTIGGIAAENKGYISKSTAKLSIDTLLVEEGSSNAYIGGAIGHNDDNNSDRERNISHLQAGVHIKLAKISTFKGIFLGGLIGTTGGPETTISETNLGESFGFLEIDSLDYSFIRSYFPPFIGGFIGKMYFTNVFNSHSYLKINRVGGTNSNKYNFAPLAGLAHGHIYNSYAIGYIDPSSKINILGLIDSCSSPVSLTNTYYDASLLPAGVSIYKTQYKLPTIINVLGKDTESMTSESFVEVLNTNAGLSDVNSGIWKHCPGNYPIISTDKTCEDFYLNYAISSSSASSSSSAEISSSSGVSSSSVSQSSSSSAVSSSSTMAPSSSSVVSSSSAASSSSAGTGSSSSSLDKSSSSEQATLVKNHNIAPSYQISVNGYNVVVANVTNVNIRIFDLLGHQLERKPVYGTGSANFTVAKAGVYILRIGSQVETINVR